jgi:hypothetical protein
VVVFPAAIVKPVATGKLVIPVEGMIILSLEVGTAAGLQFEVVFQSVEVVPVQVAKQGFTVIVVDAVLVHPVVAFVAVTV